MLLFDKMFSKEEKYCSVKKIIAKKKEEEKTDKIIMEKKFNITNN